MGNKNLMTYTKSGEINMTSSLNNEYLDHDEEKRAKLAWKVQQIRWVAALEFRSAQLEMLITHPEMPRRTLERIGCGSGEIRIN